MLEDAIQYHLYNVMQHSLPVVPHKAVAEVSK